MYKLYSQWKASVARRLVKQKSGMINEAEKIWWRSHIFSFPTISKCSLMWKVCSKALVFINSTMSSKGKSFLETRKDASETVTSSDPAFFLMPILEKNSHFVIVFLQPYRSFKKVVINFKNKPTILLFLLSVPEFSGLKGISRPRQYTTLTLYYAIPSPFNAVDFSQNRLCGLHLGWHSGIKLPSAEGQIHSNK